jgi:chemosensory pili system protein ChpA (sensor histidine kinase/response regulator)
MPDVASQTFDFVGRELNATLGEARTALESYVEQPDNLQLLERCKQELHQVQGVLRVLEIYGAALLAEEMEQVTTYLLATAAERKNQAESLDALMRAMVQLPSYLERVLAGGRDLALVLLPLLNDLRAVRGSALLSEGTLLLLNLKSDKQAQPVAAAPGEPPLTVEQWARRLRARFQVGLIGWIRGERIEQNLDILAAVSQKLEQIATRQPLFQLWWVVGAVIEALQENGLEGGVSIKRLLGLADREIKRLYEQGESRYTQNPPVELLNNLLYYVGRAETSGPRVTAVRASFRLSELLPVDEAVEQERENLSAPSVKLMQTVAAAIREDLGKVKDVLDIFVRRGAGQPQELASQVEMLRKIGDTLGVLGLGELRASVQGETERLEKIVGGRLTADEATLVEIAATLISVEDRLDDRLVGMIMPRATTGTGVSEDSEFRVVQGAVLRECILNLARVKEAIAQNVGGVLDAAGLDSWQDLMRGLKAALLMLGKTRAVEIIDEITTQLKRVMQPGGSGLPSGFVDRLADAIVSVEYYMETLQAGRSDPWYMLDNAHTCLQMLASEATPSVPTVAPLDPSTFARTVQIPTAAMPGEFESTDVGLTPPTLAPRPSVSLPEKADPELVNLFIEEAREELTKIQRHFPAWEQNPLEQDGLVTIRRSFHTLKGSGRMVGARDLSEFAWSVENLLNRLLDNTLTRSPQILAVLRDAVNALPQLIEQLETGRSPQVDTSSIVSRAHALASTKPARPAGAGTEEERAPVAEKKILAAAPPPPPENVPAAEPPKTEPPVVSSQLGSDDLLRDIYSRETGAHVATVRAYLERERTAPSPHTLTEDVYRACHTLSGSSKMAEARHGIRLAEPLDHWLRKSFNSGVGLDDADLTLLSDCMMAMESVATHLDESTGYFLGHDGLRERIVDSEAQLDARIAEAARLAAEDAAAQPRAAAEAPKPEPEPVAPELQEQAQVEQLPGVGAVEIVPAEAITLESPEPVGFESSTVESVTLSEDSVQHEEGESEHIESVVLEASTFRPAVPPAEEDDETPTYHTDFDPEVASIFTEEATELIDVSEHALNEWRGEPENAELRSALKRPMHTLKGGARMAGIVPMGDLSHEIETLVMQVDNGVVPANDAMFSVLQSCLDELARMREAVAASQPVAHARKHIARIHALSGKGPPVAEPIPAKEKAPEPAASAADVRPLEAAIIPAIPALPPGGAVEGMAFSTPVPAIVDEISAPAKPAEPEPRAPAEISSFAAFAASSPSIGGTAAAESRGDDSVVPFVERRSSAPVAARAVFPAQKAEGGEDHLAPPAPVPPGREPVAPSSDRPEMARVDAELLDTLLNTAGEVSIARARLEQQMGSIDFNLAELGRTVTRLKEQLRKLEIETEAQILHRHEEEAGSHRSDFDPLELDRYSSIQQFSRALAETANDVQSIQGLLDTLAQDTQNLLQQQARTITELQNGLMRTRMVPFQRHVQRLARIVRQAAADTGKRAELVIEGAAGELDRQVLERMLPPFEHMLRNSVVHGIEKPDERVAAGKSDTGRIKLELHREGAEVMVRLTDDGAGMNLKAIRDKGHALGLIPAGQTLSDEDAMQLILEPGFSTAGTITQQAGRGVGMDVVATEIKRLGGALHMETHAGQGTSFTIRLPFTLAISHALVVRTGEEYYALPLPTVEGVLRLSKSEVASHLGRDQATFDYNGQKYRFQNLALFVGLEPSPLPEQDVTIPVVLVRAGEHSTGLIADELVGSREIVVKSVGPQVSSIRGISGATILGDGRIVVILDIGALVRAEWRGRAQPVQREKTDRRTFVMVVDDSITVRRVTQRLLERNGMRVITARDGLDAVGLLQDHVPDIILLDIEMPRMDGYEVAAHVRNDPRLANVPIIMITSRVGEKHRARAIELGVNDYLGKPYQEAQLLDAIAPLVERHRMTQTGRRLAELEARG